MIKIKCENAHACVHTTLWKHQDIMINAKVKMWISFFSENSPIYMLCHACARVPIESCYHTLCLWSQQDLFMYCWLNRHHKCLQGYICTQEESAFSPIVIGVCSHDTQEKFWMYLECFWGHFWARNITSAFFMHLHYLNNAGMVLLYFVRERSQQNFEYFQFKCYDSGNWKLLCM